jgi:hypothetical protein
MSAPVLLDTKTVWTWGQLASASSTVLFSATFFLPKFILFKKYSFTRWIFILKSSSKSIGNVSMALKNICLVVATTLCKVSACFYQIQKILSLALLGDATDHENTYRNPPGKLLQVQKAAKQHK